MSKVHKINYVTVFGIVEITVGILGAILISRKYPLELRRINDMSDLPIKLYGISSNNVILIVSYETNNYGIVTGCRCFHITGKSLTYTVRNTCDEGLNIDFFSVIFEEVLTKLNGICIDSSALNAYIDITSVGLNAVAIYNISVYAAICNILNLKGVVGSDKLTALIPLVVICILTVANDYANGFFFTVISFVNALSGNYLCLAVIEYSGKNYVVIGHLGNSITVLIYPAKEVIDSRCKISHLSVCRKEAGSYNLTANLIVDTVDLFNINGYIGTEGKAVLLVVLGNKAKKDRNHRFIYLGRYTYLSKHLIDIRNHLRQALFDLCVSDSVSSFVSEVTVRIGNLIVGILISENVEYTVVHVLLRNVINCLVCDTNTVVKSDVEVSLIFLSEALDLIIIKSAEIYILTDNIVDCIVGKNTLKVNAVNKSHKIVEGQFLDKGINVIAISRERTKDLGLKSGIDKI